MHTVWSIIVPIVLVAAALAVGRRPRPRSHRRPPSPWLVGTVSLAAGATLTYAWLGFTQAPLDGTVHRVAVARGSVRPSERALAPDLARRGPAEVLLRRLGYGTPWRKVD